MISLIESKIGRDPTKYILPRFLKNKTDLLNALGKNDYEWLNYFSSLRGMMYNDVNKGRAVP